MSKHKHISIDSVCGEWVGLGFFFTDWVGERHWSKDIEQERSNDFSTLRKLSITLAAHFSATIPNQGVSPQPILDFTSTVESLMWRRHHTPPVFPKATEMLALCDLYMKAEMVIWTLLETLTILPGKSKENVKTADNKTAACIGHYAAAIFKGENPPSNDELAKLAGCDRTLAYKATKTLRSRTKGAMQAEVSSRQEKKTGKMNRATKNGDLCNMAKNSSRDDD
jgi:hypothetical protein